MVGSTVSSLNDQHTESMLTSFPRFPLRDLFPWAGDKDGRPGSSCEEFDLEAPVSGAEDSFDLEDECAMVHPESDARDDLYVDYTRALQVFDGPDLSAVPDTCCFTPISTRRSPASADWNSMFGAIDAPGSAIALACFRFVFAHGSQPTKASTSCIMQQ